MDPWGIPLLLALPLLMAIVPIIGYGRTQRLQAFVRDPRLTALGWFFLLYGASVIVQSGGAVVHFSTNAEPLEAIPGDIFLVNATAEPAAHGTEGRSSSMTHAGQPAPGVRVVRFNETGDQVAFNFIRAEPILWPFWLRHGLVIAALGIVAVAYLRPQDAPARNGAPTGGPAPNPSEGIDATAPDDDARPPRPPLMLAVPWLAPLLLLAVEAGRAMQRSTDVPLFVLANAVLQTVEACLALAPSILAFFNWRLRRSKGSLQVAIGFGLVAAAHIAFLLTVFTQPPVLVPLFDLLALAGITTLVFAVPRGP